MCAASRRLQQRRQGHAGVAWRQRAAVLAVAFCSVLLAPQAARAVYDPTQVKTEKPVGGRPEALGEFVAVPWLAPRSPPPPYVGLHNDLDKLLEVQGADTRFGRTVTWTWYTAPWLPMLLNWVYSLVTYGKVNSYIVVALDGASLESCMKMNLPCYNATWMAPELAAQIPATAELDPGSPLFADLMKWKPAMALELVKRGYDIHFSDPDAVVVKDVYRSIQRKVELFHSDGTAMRELWADNVISVGHYYLRNTPRVLKLLQAWATDDGQRASFPSDQAYLHHFRGPLWDVCYSGYNCTRLMTEGKAGINGHQEQVSGWWGEQCPNIHKWWPCPEHTLELHFLCIQGGQPEKVHWMKHYDLWFFENITSLESWRAFSRPNGQGGGHAFLPCKDELAWRTTTLSSAYGDVWDCQDGSSGCLKE